MKNQQYIQGNKKYWDEVTPLHAKSEFYELQSFKEGKSSLMSLEIEEIGDIKNKSFLHLQCHFGMDTLSWARLGATVTGVDLSEKSIAFAKQLGKELNVKARFIASDIYDLPSKLNEQFDVVYNTGGVLCWLPDISGWAKVVSRCVKKGGIFYLRDGHPVSNIFDDNMATVGSGYFYENQPIAEIPNGTYATAENVDNIHYEWHHSLGDIINALINSGLNIKFIHEFPFTGWARFPKHMQKEADGWYHFKDKKVKIPLMFSMLCYK